MKKAIYGFSGDPITYGHIDIIKRALDIFGELTVGIGMNPAKKYFFSLEERKEIAKESLKFLPNVKVIAFRGLLVDYAYENNISTVIRGLRNSEDLNYEMMLHQIGESQKLNIDTLYFPAKQELTHVSSGAVKALQLEQGFIHKYVPLFTKQKMEEKLSKQNIIAVTGEIGVGKTHVCNQIQKLSKKKGIDVHIIDIDKIGHEILGTLTEPLYKKLRLEIADIFGHHILKKDGFIDRQILGKIIFNNPQKLELFNNILYKPLLLKLRRELYGKRGLILLDTALISESKMNYLSNNNVILISTNKDIQRKRLLERGYSEEQMNNRIKSQYDYLLKEQMIKVSIQKDLHGTLWKYDNSTNDNHSELNSLFDCIISDLKIQTT